MRYVHAYPSHAYVCIFHALRGKRNHPPRVENARVRFLRPPHNGHATAIIFQWWRSKLRVYILYADTYGQILARARCVYGWKLWNFLLCAASSKMDEMVLWTFECSMPDWISFCVIGFLFARLCNFRFGIYIYTDWSV